MTRTEFKCALPGLINHPTWGEGFLEIVVDQKNLKGACYRHENEINNTSHGTYGKTWKEVSDKLMNTLKNTYD